MARGISGKLGYVVVGSCTIAELTEWNATLDKDLKMYNSRSGGGWQKTVVGNKKVTGSIKGKYDSGDPIDAQLNTDSLVSLSLRFDSSPAEYLFGSARLGSLEFTVNNDTGDIEEWTCNFESDGSWSFT